MWWGCVSTRTLSTSRIFLPRRMCRRIQGSLLSPVQEVASCAKGPTPLHWLGALPHPCLSFSKSKKEQLMRILRRRESVLGRPGSHAESRGALSDSDCAVVAPASHHLRSHSQKAWFTADRRPCKEAGVFLARAGAFVLVGQLIYCPLPQTLQTPFRGFSVHTHTHFDPSSPQLAPVPGAGGLKQCQRTTGSNSQLRERSPALQQLVLRLTGGRVLYIPGGQDVEVDSVEAPAPLL